MQNTTAVATGPDSVDVLVRTVVPALFPARTPRRDLRVWVIGLADGDEVRTGLEILTRHAAEQRVPLRVFVTDADPEAVSVWRRTLRRRPLWHPVLFARHALLADPPFRRLDFIWCRRLVLPAPSMLRGAASILHRALRYGGLLLGPPLPGDVAEGLFTPLETEPRVLQRVAVPRRRPLRGEQIALEDRVQQLLTRTITAEEEERSRLARDLHDQLGPQLTATRLKLDALLASVDAGPLRPALAEIVRDLERLDRELDFVMWGLRPPALEQLGLAGALTTFVDEWSAETGIAATCHADDVAAERFSAKVGINLYRIVQESLNNVVKHARATSVDVRLERRDRAFVLTISDNGCGFNAAEPARGVHPGLGLPGMAERAALIGGHADIESTPGQGTRVIVTVPRHLATESV